jgi:glycine cleavage system H protein
VRLDRRCVASISAGKSRECCSFRAPPRLAMADTLKFTDDHLWIRVEGKRAQIGISEYGQNELGEVIAVEMPDVGDEMERGEPFGEVESVRTVSELISPLSGSVTAINTDLEDHPRIVNEDPLHEGWLVEVELADEAELEDLMDLDEYEEFASGEQDG